MNPNETSVNGTRPIFYTRELAEQHGTSSFNSMPIFDFNSDYDQELINILIEKDDLDSTLCNGPCLCGQCHMVQSLPSFPDDSMSWSDIDNFPLPIGTERDNGSSPSMVSQVSTYSCPTMPSTPEETEALNEIEGIKSVIDNNSRNCIYVSNPENSVLPAELRKPGCSRTCRGCVWPASACHDAHRLTASEDAIIRKFFKGVKEKNSDKWTCEIRISKKLLQDSKLKTKGKLWLGTFDTRCQAARALHVGRFLLTEKKKSSTADATTFERSTETILSEFKNLMRGMPLDVKLLERVKKLAIDYGKNGLL